MTPAHGTPARARQHYRDGTPMCEPCRRAQRRDSAQRRRAGKPDPDTTPSQRFDWTAAITRVRAMLDGMATG